MKKLAAYIAGFLVLLNAYTAEGLSRKELKIPERGSGIFLGFEADIPGAICLQYDTNGDGMPNIEELYLWIKTEPGKFEPSESPFYLWFDRNHNGKMEKGEIYRSEQMNEDWEQTDELL